MRVAVITMLVAVAVASSLELVPVEQLQQGVLELSDLAPSNGYKMFMYEGARCPGKYNHWVREGYCVDGELKAGSTTYYSIKVVPRDSDNGDKVFDLHAWTRTECRGDEAAAATGAQFIKCLVTNHWTWNDEKVDGVAHAFLPRLS